MVEFETRFTARLRQFKKANSPPPPPRKPNTKWKSLGAELKAKTNEGDGESCKIIEKSLKSISDSTRIILGEDSNPADREELGIKLYRRIATFVDYEAVTQTYDEIDNIQKEHFIKIELIFQSNFDCRKSSD